MNKIAIIGLGLIGGSLARTIRLRMPNAEVYGCDLNKESIQQALMMDAITAELDDEKLRSCDMVLVALYPQGIIDWITAHQHDFADGCLVIDCGGVKQTIVGAIEPLAEGKKWHFIGGHPMAGREFSGFKYARDNLFENASMILTPNPVLDLTVMQTARDFFMDLGFRQVQFTTPKTHDEMIAYTSQLSHIVSSAYVKSDLAKKHRGFSAGSFRDMTRVARLNEHMWTELFFANREALLPEVDAVVERLAAYRDALREADRDKMMQLLREGRETKESLEDA